VVLVLGLLIGYLFARYTRREKKVKTIEKNAPGTTGI